MTLTLAAFVITILASISVGIAVLLRSRRKEAWLEKFEAARTPPKDTLLPR